jgi:hypothetical protein
MGIIQSVIAVSPFETRSLVTNSGTSEGIEEWINAKWILNSCRGNRQ